MQAIVDAAYGHYVERLGKAPGPMLDDYEAVARSPLAFVMTLGEAQHDDGAIVGLVVLIERDHGMLLDNVALHPSASGRGLGRQLLRFAEEHTLTAGHSHLDLYTHELMHENITLYQRLGYVETGRRQEAGYARVYIRKGLAG